MQLNNSSPVLVIGASGYLASHLVKLLLEKDYKVRGTVRSLANKDKYSFLYDLVPEKKNNLELVEGDLTEKTCWLKAVEGCKYVFHVALPIPNSAPKDDMEIIGPLVGATENVLEAALEKGVKKVVVTSSSLTVMYPGNDAEQVSEEDWSNEAFCHTYAKGKIRAEKLTWKIYEEHKDKLEVTTLLPSLVLGPMFINHGNGATLLKDILEGSFPGVLDVKLELVDVRDVAIGHLNAMFNQNTEGRRYVCTGDAHSLGEVIAVMKKEFEKVGYKINDKEITVEEAAASGNAWAKRLSHSVGKPAPRLINERSIKELGMQYTPFEQTIIDMGHSLIKLGVVKKP